MNGLDYEEFRNNLIELFATAIYELKITGDVTHPTIKAYILNTVAAVDGGNKKLMTMLSTFVHNIDPEEQNSIMRKAFEENKFIGFLNATPYVPHLKEPMVETKKNLRNEEKRNSINPDDLLEYFLRGRQNNENLKPYEPTDPPDSEGPFG